MAIFGVHQCHPAALEKEERHADQLPRRFKLYDMAKQNRVSSRVKNNAFCSRALIEPQDATGRKEESYPDFSLPRYSPDCTALST
jgi:hypothetical protein